MKTKMNGFVMLFIGLLAGIVIASTAVVNAAEPKVIEVQQADVQLVIDGKNSPERPVVINGKSYLPLRTIAEVFGFDVDWNTESRTVTITSRDVEGPETQN